MYYFTEYFSNNRRLLTWSTPLERSAYAVGLIVMLWLLTVLILFGIILNISIPALQNKIVMLVSIGIIGIVAIYLVEYIYISKKRYDYITSKEYNSFKTNYKIGVIISISILFASILVLPLLGILIHIIGK
jgi:hypothetical protein